MQDRKKDTDVYTRLLDSEGEGEGGMIWENGNSNMQLLFWMAWSLELTTKNRIEKFQYVNLITRNHLK